ncbi:MAG: MTAP family purine nucleoside phosphorylase [Bacteroidota bacterium]|nr:MTAP family purine nucleoside phosphorylase [Bacteroidota bacterium]
MEKVGIIGGSGLEDPDILKDQKEIRGSSRWGDTTSPLLSGKINNHEVILLARHGREHTIPPTQVNNRANIWALKENGCSKIISTTACGSLREEIGRGHIIIPDQFIDFTRRRELSFYDVFDPGDMKHTPMADPFDRELRNLLIKAGSDLDFPLHESGTIITIEGPRFSTRAESKMFRMWNADLVNMSIAPEAILANELGIPYVTIAMSTDYDSWHEDEEPVSWQEVIRIFNENVSKVVSLIQKFFE